MRPVEIRAVLKKQPFRPVRVFLSDGAYYDIRHPEMVLVGQRDLVIGLDPSSEELPERMAYCDPMHVTRIEPLTANTAT
jgi:hypothetical protein